MAHINAAASSSISGLKISAGLATETPLPSHPHSSPSASLLSSASSSSSSYAESTDVLYSLPIGSERVFTGPYASTRAGLDYSYHANYVPERQAVQDTIIGRFLSGGARISTSRTVPTSDGSSTQEDSQLSSAAALTTQRSDGPWLVYTAGAMGAGKSHTLRYLSRENLFPLDRFIVVDRKVVVVVVVLHLHLKSLHLMFLDL